jgi:hypothetical protein
MCVIVLTKYCVLIPQPYCVYCIASLRRSDSENRCASQDGAAVDRAETMANLASSPAGRCRLANLAAALAARFAATTAAILPSTAVACSDPLDQSGQPAGRPAFALSDYPFQLDS